MADLPPGGKSNDDTSVDTGTPRWAYVLAIIVVVLVLVFVILHVTGDGFGRHTAS
jgi:hypothetical protein